MIKQGLDKQLRVFILDTLIAQSGKQLTPDIIGDLTAELVERVLDLLAKSDVEY